MTSNIVYQEVLESFKNINKFYGLKILLFTRYLFAACN